MDVKKPDFVGNREDFPININPKAVAGVIVAIVLAFWIVRGGPAYTVSPAEEGVVLTFGKYARTTQPGLHFKYPWPIQTVELPNIAEWKRIEFGFRTTTRNGEKLFRDFTDNVPQFLHEAQMLTGDENIVNCSMVVQYRVQDSRKYLFNFRTEEEVAQALKDIGEAAIRQAVGDRPIDHVLTIKKSEIQIDVQRKMQELADMYGAGVTIGAVQLQNVLPPREVASAFQEVASAREKREQIKNEALGYQQEQIPQAEGEAQRMILDAEGYKAARIADASGEVARFLAIMKEFELAPEVTRSRMYLEAMSELLPKMRITIIDEAAGLINVKSLGGAAMPILGAGQTKGRQR